MHTTSNACGKGGKLFFRLLFFCITILFTSYAQPVIRSISPTKGPAGTLVTIIGSGFSNTIAGNIVNFGAMKATVLSAKPDTLRVTVPTGTTYQPVSISANGYTAYSSRPFTLSMPPGVITQNSFTPQLRLPAASSATASVKIADIDGDGKNDVIVANRYGDSISVYRNNSTASILSFTETRLPADDAYALTVGDLNSDGKPEIITTSFSSSVIKIRKNISTPGNVLFAPGIDLAAGPLTTGAAIDDCDGDGRADLIVASAGENNVSVFRNSAGGDTIAFDAKVNFPALSPYDVKSADLNGDGKPEFVVANNQQSTVTVWLNHCSPHHIDFEESWHWLSASMPVSLEIADIMGDEQQDIMVAGNSGIAAMPNSGGSFNNEIGLYTGSETSAGIALADIDGDGKPDFTVANPGAASIALFKNESDAISFITADPIMIEEGTPGVYACQSSALGDLNGDGKVDLVAAVSANSYQGFVEVWLNRINDTAIASFSPRSAKTGTTITITGTGFNNVSSVRFGGVPAASFAVTSATEIKAVVGTGASGLVTVADNRGISTIPGFVYINDSAIKKITCSGNGTGFRTPVSGSIYHWQVDRGLGFEDVLDNNIYSGNNTDSLSIASAPQSFNGYQYRCKITTGSSIQYSPVFQLKLGNIWTGAADNNWENVNNWQCDNLPGANSDVYIQTGTPVIHVSTTIKSLSIENGALLTVTPAVQLKITD